MEDDERREGQRCRASFEMQVVGLETRAVMRRGDLSLLGVYVETSTDCGDPGTLHSLRLRTRDRAIRIEVPARVARVVRSDDLLEGSMVSGVAFEFLSYDPGVKEAVEAFVLHVARKTVEAAKAPEHPTRGLSLSLETGWQLRKGERVRVEVPSSNGGRLRLEGRAVRSRRSAKGSYRTRVDLVDPTAATTAEQGMAGPMGIRDALNTGSSPPVPAGEETVSDFRGDLSKLRATALLTLASLEQLTGVLSIAQADATVRVFLRAGRVVDVEGEGLPKPEQDLDQLLGDVCLWDWGTFELELVPVDRVDQIRRSTTSLLIDLARLHDEAQRVA